MNANNNSQAPARGSSEYGLTAADLARFAEEQAGGMVSAQDPLLHQAMPRVHPNKIGSARVQAVISRLHSVATGQRRRGSDSRKHRTLVGLAAPQIGEAYRIVLIDTKVDESRKHYGRLECFINPEIVWRSREMAEGREGCFSTGPVWGLVRRPVAVKIRALDARGRRVERILEGFSARIACHELDHLDGVRFPERIHADSKRHWVHTEELVDYPEQIKRWPRKCSLEGRRQFSGQA
jgi:peptide deformylase